MERQSDIKMSQHIINEHPKSNKLIKKFDKKCYIKHPKLLGYNDRVYKNGCNPISKNLRF